MACPTCGRDHNTTVCPPIVMRPPVKTDLQRVADALERIAVALEKIARQDSSPGIEKALKIMANR